MSRRSQFLRDNYPHEGGRVLVTTAQAAALVEMTTRTLLRRLHGAGVEPARRGRHGRMLWRTDDLHALVDNESHPCHSSG